jgi:hypothetical protein
MTLYLQNQQTTVTWPEPLEAAWQLLGGECACDLAPKLPHVGLADILFMTGAWSPGCLTYLCCPGPPYMRWPNE